MTSEKDPRQEVETVVTPGKGVQLAVPGEATQINLARERRNHALAQRHPARLGLPPVPRGVVERTVADDEIERGARIVGMRDPNPAPKHREGPALRKRDAALAAVRRWVGAAE